MNIADFLEDAKSQILDESIAYARTITSLKDEDDVVLRNHLPKILEAISADLRTAQSRTQSIEKSHGLAPASDRTTAAETHGLMRARSGLHIEQVVAEYRVLRSCVLRLWTEAAPWTPDGLRDATRFSEAIDQAVAESVRVHAGEVHRWQQIFLGVLGHDLRAPLNAITLTAEVLARKPPKDASSAIVTLKRSASRMASLLDSLLEYNKAGLGNGMVIQRLPIDLHLECAEEVELLRAALPAARIEWVTEGSTWGDFDASRIREALSNLVTNAVKHGRDSQPVIVRLQGQAQVVRLQVENAVDHDISADELEQLFEPLRRGAQQRAGVQHSHLGLGLFIVRQIVKAHGGVVEGHSGERRVCFTVTLPKVAAADQEVAGR